MKFNKEMAYVSIVGFYVIGGGFNAIVQANMVDLALVCTGIVVSIGLGWLFT